MSSASFLGWLPALLMLMTPAAGEAQGLTHPASDRVDDPLLAEILSFAEVVDLNELQPDLDKNVAIRLYAVPRLGGCALETEWVCSYDYYLAVHEYDLLPNHSVYSLGQLGEIAEVRWLPESRWQFGRLRVEILKYPRSAVEENPNLGQQGRVFELLVSTDSMTVSEISP